jgi:hypothetical protein
MSFTQEEKIMRAEAQAKRQIQMFDAKDSCPHLIKKIDKKGNRYVFCNNTYLGQKTPCWAIFRDDFNVKDCHTAWKIKNPIEAEKAEREMEEEEEYCKLIIEQKCRDLNTFNIPYEKGMISNQECPQLHNLEEDDFGLPSNVLEQFHSIYFCDNCRNPTNRINDQNKKEESICSEENCPIIHPDL